MHVRRSLLSLCLVLIAACSTGAAGVSTGAADLSTAASPGPRGRLTAYADEAQFMAALERWQARSDALRQEWQLQRQRELRARREAEQANGSRALTAPPLSTVPAPAAPPSEAAPMPPMPPMPTMAAKSALAAGPAESRAAPAGAAADAITNVQTLGVDEGGIVKTAGDHLVILRRGRLFTVRVGSDDLRPVASIDAFAPGADPRGAWYDEMLISGSTIVVVGFSYQRGGTEIGLFDIGRNGSLAYRATYHLRSSDYFSSRNYASRLIGSQLIFYTASQLNTWGANGEPFLPAMRRWQPQMPEDFQRILPAKRIFRTDDDFEPGAPLALHTVTRCELAAQPMRCDSSAVLGPPGRVFYVAQNAVYVWTAAGRNPFQPGLGAGRRPPPSEAAAAVFRMPLDGAAPSAIKTVGVPIDQLSFLEDRGHLNVLLRDSGAGEGMFGGERGASRLALLRLPLSALGDGKQAAAREFYRRLPGTAAWNLQNRHVGDWLLWGGGNQAYAMRPAAADEPVTLEPGHLVERIEGMGRDAVLVGNRGDELRFTAVSLGAGATRLRAGAGHTAGVAASDVRAASCASLAGTFARPGGRQGETRTHGFFYKPLQPVGRVGGGRDAGDRNADSEGLLGLPVLGAESPGRAGIYNASRGAANVVFLRQRDLQFTGLGELSARVASGFGRSDDGCKASCVDWYGNARPIFLGERIFALLGYELVEGALPFGGGAIEERRRVDFTPTAGRPDGRPSPFQ